MPFNTFATRADHDQEALAWSGSTLFAYGNMIRYDPAPVDLTRNFFVLQTWKFIEKKYLKWVELSMNIHKGKG